MLNRSAVLLVHHHVTYEWSTVVYGEVREGNHIPMMSPETKPRKVSTVNMRENNLTTNEDFFQYMQRTDNRIAVRWTSGRSGWMVLWVTLSSGRCPWSRQEVGSRWSSKIPSNLNYSMILWMKDGWIAANQPNKVAAAPVSYLSPVKWETFRRFLRQEWRGEKKWTHPKYVSLVFQLTHNTEAWEKNMTPCDALRWGQLGSLSSQPASIPFSFLPHQQCTHI